MLLAIESSCDETAVALFDPRRGLEGEWLHSQIALHEGHGGVVPDLAAREHLRRVAPLLSRALGSPRGGEVGRIAVTYGPGLAPCLAIGLAAAKSLALARGAPLVGVSHLRGHVWSPFIPVHAEAPAEFPARRAALLPHLGLVVSGGHTLLCEVDANLRVTAVASTLDDAAGEALDKGAKLLGMGYPGGPAIERLAREGRRDAFDFPRSVGARGDREFSFSGLKTSLRYLIEKMPAERVRECLPDLCASYQEAVVDALATKASAALDRGSFRSLGLSGGVAANGRLRETLASAAKRSGVAFLPARPEHTGDNAAMIAFAAWADPSGASADGMRLRIDPALYL